MQRNIVITSTDCIREYLPDKSTLIIQMNENQIRIEDYPLIKFQNLLRCLMQTPEVADNIVYLYRIKENHKHLVYDEKSELKYIVEVLVPSPFLRKN